MRSSYADVNPYVTKDGSLIRELMHPTVHGNRAQSLAEAIIPPGCKTLLHRHRASEEIYYVTHGAGVMELGEAIFDIGAGDTICIAPGMPHCVSNRGTDPLRILCACAPPYDHADTEVLAASSP